MVWQTQGSTVEKDVSNDIGFIGVGLLTDKFKTHQNFRREGMQFIMDHVFFQ
jgi:hypothetical protein